jgi:hypothetical protein
MACHSVHPRMPSACGKPGHSWWMRVECHCVSPVSPRDNRSFFHISTPGPSTACGRRGALRAVDKWHVSVDKPPRLGKGQDCEQFCGGLSRARRARQSEPLYARARSLSALSSTQFLVVHRQPLPSSEAAQSAAGVLPQLMRVLSPRLAACHPPPHLPRPYDGGFY